MKVLYLTHNFPSTPEDPAGSFVLRLASAVRSAGAEVAVLAPASRRAAGRDAVAGIAVERYRYAPRAWETLASDGTMAEQVGSSWRARAAFLGMLLAGRGALARAVRRERPDVIHAHWWVPAGMIAALPTSPRPLVITSHGSDIRLARGSRAATTLFRRVVGRASAVTTVSRWLADEAARLAPHCAPIVAPMPVATERFAPVADRTSDRVLFVGRLNAQKGVAPLLEALATVTVPWQLDVVGEGPDRAALEALAHARGLAGRVHWHGSVPNEKLAPYYARAACTVVPSADEGLGLVAVEALLCGAPVVAYDSGGLRDVITSGVTGSLVPMNVLALARGITRVLANPDGARAEAMVGRTQMLGRFSASAVARRYLDLYRAVRDGSPA
ncbi:MAG: glycosyltransferase [Gemmatimonadaceae bacterium]|nr:glycosyltransferase [Gemmatimonadaceae bacterium]